MNINVPLVFRKVAESLDIVRTNTEKYLKYIVSQLEKDDPQRLININKELQRYKDVAKQLLSYEAALDTIEQVLDLYSVIDPIENNSGPLVEVLSKESYYKTITGKMSSTYNIDVDKTRESAMNAWDKYRDALFEADNIILDAIVKKIGPTEIATLMTKKYEHSRIVLHVLRLVAPSAPDAVKKKIQIFTEKSKDSILGSKRHPELYNSSLFPIQAHTYRYGLVPSTQFITVGEIFTLLGKTYDPEKHRDANIKGLAAGQDGVVVMKNIVGTAMAFEMRGLIDHKYMTENDLSTSISEGLNNKVLKRFNTTMFVGGPQNTPPAPYHYRNVPVGAERIFVFETFDGYKYRLLSETSDKYYVGRDSVNGYIYGANDRPQKYNEIISNVIMSECVTRTTEEVVTRYESLEPTHNVIMTAGMTKDTSIVRVGIHDKLMAHINIAKKPPKNEEEAFSLYRDMIHYAPIVLGEVLTPGIGTEERITYLAKIDDIERKLYRELLSRFRGKDFAPTVFEHKVEADIVTHTTQSFSNSIDDALNDMESNGVWALYDASLKELYLSAMNLY
jgi:hypothetical protein